MTRSKKSLRAGLTAVLGLALCAPARAESVSISEYRQQLEDLSREAEQLQDSPLHAAQLASSLPEKITVNNGTREYTISYKWLKDELKLAAQPDLKRRSAALGAARSYLDMLRESARRYETEKPAGPDERAKVNEILSRREFRQAHAPDLLAIWSQKVLRKIEEFFSRSSRGPKSIDAFEVLIYVVVALALSFFAIWLKRRLDRPREELTREIIPFSPSARGWRTWLTEARSAAQREDWRNSIHLAYWAGISFLEEHGAWRPDRARTPREYLKLLTIRHSDHSTLTALTRKFEVVWYGNREANAGDFQEALGQLEKLGCK